MPASVTVTSMGCAPARANSRARMSKCLSGVTVMRTAPSAGSGERMQLLPPLSSESSGSSAPGA